MSSMPWPPRSGRLAQRAAGDGRSRGWLGGAAPAFREARGPGGRDALVSPGRTHPARHTAPGRLGPPPPAVGFGDLALRIRTLDRKIAELNERIEAEVEASGTALTEIFGIGPILAAKIIGT